MVVKQCVVVGWLESRSVMSCFAAGVTGFVVLSGCTSYGPKGDTGGIVPTEERIAGTNRDPSASAEELLAFAEKVAKSASARIADTPEMMDAPTRVVVVVGDITNRSNTSRSDLATVRRRMFTSLMRSEAVRENVMFVESKEKVNAAFNRERPPEADDRLDERRTPKVLPPSYDPNIVYYLNVEFGELNRGQGRASTYVADATLMNVGTGQIIFAEEYDFKQVR